jgi:hypothetical protein
MVIATVVVLQPPLAIDGPPELPSPDDERVVEHPPGLEIGKERCLRLIDVPSLLGDVRRQPTVLVPAAVVELLAANVPGRRAASP